MNIKQNAAEVILICLVIVGLMIFFGYKYILVNLHSLNVDLASKQQELSQKEDKLENLKNMKNKLASLQSTLEMMQRALPKGADIPDLLVSTEALVGASGLGMASFTPPASNEAGTPAAAPTEGGTAPIPQVVTNQTGISSLSYSLSLQGSYPAFLTFLDNVEKNLRPTSVKSINITGGGSDKPLTYSVNMVSYYQK